MRKIIPALALLIGGACQELEVTNPNEPDRDRATRQPAATESFVASSFRPWWRRAGHDDYPSWAFSTMANEITSGFADFGQLELSAEPRSAWNNSPVNARNLVTEGPWYDLYAAISAANDGAAAIENGLIITNQQNTDRTLAFAKFMQGLSHGYLGLYFDSAFVVDESVQLDTITEPQLRYYPEVIAAAIQQLDSAIAIASRNDFSFPSGSWMFVDMTADEFVQLANSFVARLLVYSARTPAERAGVDWAEVIARIDAGIEDIPCPPLPSPCAVAVLLVQDPLGDFIGQDVRLVGQEARQERLVGVATAGYVAVPAQRAGRRVHLVHGLLHRFDTDPVVVGSDPSEPTAKLTTSGRATGVLLGGNQDSIATAAGWALPPLEGAILLIEAFNPAASVKDRLAVNIIEAAERDYGVKVLESPWRVDEAATRSLREMV